MEQKKNYRKPEYEEIKMEIAQPLCNSTCPSYSDCSVN